MESSGRAETHLQRTAGPPSHLLFPIPDVVAEAIAGAHVSTPMIVRYFCLVPSAIDHRAADAFFLRARHSLAPYIMPIGMPIGPTTIVSATFF